MNKLVKQINKLLEKDKVKHLLIGLIIYLSLARFTHIFIALIITFIIGVGKEVYDKISKKGKPEFMDFIYTVAIPSILCIIETLIK